MPPLHLISRCLVLMGVSLTGVSPAAAQLSASSPFLPPQSGGAAAPTQGAPLEFAGYLTTPEGTLYVVRDPAKKTSAFLKVNERDPVTGAMVKQHDNTQNTLTIEHQGRTMTLEARKAKIVSSGNPAMMMAAPVPQPMMPTVAPAVTQTVVPNPTPADEQKRLEAVAAEVARRRALREQASQQMQGGIPQPGPAQTQPTPNVQPTPQGNFQPAPPANAIRPQ